MSVEVCVLANWEVDGYEKWLHNRDVLRELASATAEERDKLRPLLQADGSHPDCRNHRHLKLSTAREMVDGFRVKKIVNDRVEEVFISPTACWVGLGRRRIAALAQRANLRDLSARLGFDGRGNAIKDFGRETGEEARAREIPSASRRKIDVVPISGNNATGWIQAMLSQSPRRLPSSRSRMRTGNSGGDSSFLERRK